MAKVLIGRGNGGPIAYNANTTYYQYLGAVLEGNETTEANAKTNFLSAGVLSDLYIQVVANTVTATTTARTRVNGANGAQAVSITSTATGVFEDNSNTDSLASGDDANYQVVVGTTGTSISFNGCSICFTASSNTVTHCGSASSVGITLSAASTTTYNGLYFPSNSTTETLYKTEINHTCTHQGLDVYISANARTTTTTFRSRKNLANGGQSVSVTSTATGAFVDTTGTDSLVAGDDVDYSVTTGTGTENLVWQRINGEMVSTNNTFSTFWRLVSMAATAGTDFMQISGGSADATTEGNIQLEAKVAATLSNAYINILTNTYDSGTTLARVRINGVNGNLVISIAATITGSFRDAVNTDSVVATDLVNFAVTEAATTGTLDSREGSLLWTVPISSTGLTPARHIFRR